MKTENQLLLWLSSNHRCQSRVPELANLLDSHVDWNEVLEGAKRHRVGPLCHRFVEQLEEGMRYLVPINVRFEFACQYLTSLMRSMSLFNELKQIAAAFEKANTNVVLMKGPAIGKLVYEDIALRPFGDLDLVVLPDEYERAKHVLGELGYRQTVRDALTLKEFDAPAGLDRYECRFTRHGQPFWRHAEIDHRTLTERVSDWSVSCPELQSLLNPVQEWFVNLPVRPARFWVELHVRFVSTESGYSGEDDASVHQRARLVQFDPIVNIRVLSPEDFLIFLCEHHARMAIKWSSVIQLLDVCDVREVAIQFQASKFWEKLMATARQMRLNRSVSSMLAQASLLDISGTLKKVIPKIAPQQADFLEVFHESEEGYQCRWETPYVSRLFKSETWGDEAKRIWKEYRSKTGDIRKAICPKTRRPLDMDGCLSDPLWRRAGILTVDLEKTLKGEHLFRYEPGNISKPIGVTGYVCWEDEFLFVAVVVKDEVVICGDPAAVGVFYNQDQVRLLFWFDETVKTYALLLRPDLANGSCCLAHGAQYVQPLEGGYDCVQTAGSIGDDGYVVEVAIPFSELGVRPKDGMSIGFDLQIDDCDDAEIGVTKIVTWAGSKNNVPVPYGELCFVESID